jgi:hypothetical protein
MRIVRYTLETKAERTVCIDGVFRCPNPACQYSSPVRAWGQGFATRKTPESPLSTTKLPGELRVLVKQEAEQRAWADARQHYHTVQCPRCTRAPAPSVQFLQP